VFERDIDNPANRYYKLFHGNVLERVLFSLMMPWHVVKPDVIIAMSDETARITERAFALPKSRVAVTGFPRNDALLDPSILTARDAEKVPQEFRDAVLSDSKVFLYLPTFRDTGGWSIDFDWEALNKELVELGAKLFYKTHPVDSGKYTAAFPNIIQLPQTTEVYSLLPGTDALISDYSSVIFDFMLTGKPIIYYTPDLADFESGCRSFNFRPKEIAVGPVCMSFGELLGALRQVSANTPSIFSANREEVMGRLHKFSDSRSNERVLALIKERYYSGTLRNSPYSSIKEAADEVSLSAAERVD
jgi:CDP-glycerol glycerophosphotransferase